ncbi:hypothetical protein LINPERHAP1_LOCUS31876 [Linum perenne]
MEYVQSDHSPHLHGIVDYKELRRHFLQSRDRNLTLIDQQEVQIPSQTLPLCLGTLRNLQTRPRQFLEQLTSAAVNGTPYFFFSLLGRGDTSRDLRSSGGASSSILVGGRESERSDNDVHIFCLIAVENPDLDSLAARRPRRRWVGGSRTPVVMTAVVVDFWNSELCIVSSSTVTTWLGELPMLVELKRPKC